MAKWKCLFQEFRLKRVVAFLVIICLCVATAGMHAIKAQAVDGGSLEAAGDASGEDSVRLSSTTLNLAVGETGQRIKIISRTSEGASPEWSSSNPEVAKVSDDNNLEVEVIAGKAGKATLTVKIDNKTATCEVTVTEFRIRNTSISLEEGESSVLGIVGSLPNGVSPAWSSSNPEVAAIASIADDGDVEIAAKKAGTATITATIGSNTLTCIVTVTKSWTPGEGEVIDVESVEMFLPFINLVVGAETRLVAEVYPEHATNQELSWESDNPEVATVDKNGKVTGIAVGVAIITVTTVDGGKTATCEVTVKEPTIKFSESSLDMTVGDKAILTVSYINPPSGSEEETAPTETKAYWDTDNDVVMNFVRTGVNENGYYCEIKAMQAGVSEIYVTLGNNVTISETISCKITVKEKEPETISVAGVTLNKTDLSLTEGKTETLIATVSPANATNKAVTWISDKPAVATVDNNGKVTGKAAGTATITVTTEDGRKTAGCNVTVIPQTPAPTPAPAPAPAPTPEPAPTLAPVSVTHITLDKTSVTIRKHQSTTLQATVAPSNATNQNVTWKSNKSTVATVDNKGKVTGKKAGKATVTVTTADGRKKATCNVTVAEAKLNATSMSLQVGKSTSALKVSSKYPSNDTIKSWKSSNTKVATVTSKGKVTGKKVGTATITVTMKSGATATCTVKVQRAKVVTEKLSISSKKLTVQKGKKATLTVTRNPISATEKITWKSSNTKVATVSSSGKVTGKKVGTATITATTSNGKKVTCKVTVKNPSVTLAKKSATVKVGKTTTITVKSTFPSNDTVKSYKSSNTKVATVTSKGVVTAKKAGTATITVTMKSGAKATFKVTVKK